MFCISITFRTEMLHRLRRLQICRLRTGFFNHLTKLLRILKHRARTKHIFIKRLTVMICHENRTLQCFQQSIFINICIRIMDKYTWVYITIRIDMKVTSSSCNTSSYILRIILEIHSKNSFCRTILSDLVIHLLTLLWIRH